MATFLLTLKQLWRRIRRTATERLQLGVLMVFVAETKVRNFYVEIGVQQQILRLLKVVDICHNFSRLVNNYHVHIINLVINN